MNKHTSQLNKTKDSIRTLTRRYSFLKERTESQGIKKEEGGHDLAEMYALKFAIGLMGNHQEKLQARENREYVKLLTEAAQKDL